MKKRIVAAALSLCLLFGIFFSVPFTASAAGITLAKTTYHLVNAASGQYLTLYENKDTEGKSIKVSDFAFDVSDDLYDREARQVFKFERNKSGYYNIQPAMSSTRYIAPKVTPATNGTRVYLYTADGSASQNWYVEAYGTNAYLIRCAENSSLVLTQTDTNATVTTYKEGNKNQLWKLQEFSMRKAGDDENIKSYGIDVSQWQGEINWQAVKEYGVDFAIIRLGYSGGEDPYFEENYKAARAAGIKVGSYIYSYATSVAEAKEDAAQALKAINGKTFEYPIYFDIEDKAQASLTTELRTEMCITFMSALITEGYQSGVYANQDWFENRLDHEKIAAVGSTWLAKWPASDQADEDHSDYHLWQFRSDGNIGGIHGDVDVNVDYGNTETYYYTGAPITPQFNVYSETGAKLKEGVHYTTTYSNNVNVGTATVVYKGIGTYAGKFTLQRSFEISQRSLSDVTFKEFSERTYNGEAIKPSVNATYNGYKLKKNTDYTVSYSDNVKAGTGTITVVGKGNFRGTRSFEFTIKKKSMKYATITGIKNMAYTGKKRTLSGLKVKTSTTTLKKGRDYTVSYKNNKEFGTATVTIKGIGDNCRGTYTGTFNIVPKAPETIKVSNRTKTGVKITWGHSDYATRYQLYRATSKNGKYTRIHSTANRWEYSFSDSGLKEGTYYYYKVRSYIKVDGKKYYSAWSDIATTSTKISNTDFTISENVNDGSATINIKKNKKVTGYIVYMYKSKSKSYEKIWAGKSAKFTKTGLKYNKNYHFKIRTYKETDNGKIYGTLSSKQTVRLILPEKIKTLKASKRTTSSIKLSWDTTNDATMYQLYRATSPNGKFKRVHSTKGTSYVDKGLTEGKYYYYKVRAYRKADGEKYYGEWSDVITTKTKISDTDFKLKGSTKNKSVTVNINKNEAVTGYIVYMYKSKSKAYEKVWAGTDLSYTKTGLRSGKTYHFKVRTYKKTKYGKIYGTTSAKKSYKMK